MSFKFSAWHTQLPQYYTKGIVGGWDHYEQAPKNIYQIQPLF